MENTFRIITPVYNAEDWIGKCIQSVKDQTYTNFTQVIVDDCSTDNTLEVAKRVIGSDNRFILIKRPKKTGTMHGHLLAGNLIQNNADVFVHLDGDDWFSSNDVLNRLNNIYQDESIWCTYGNYKTTDGTPSVCKEVEDITKPIRQYLLDGWIFSQVRSFRVFLWEKLSQEDFISTDGTFMAVADVAVFVPILEMCGLDRVKFVPQVQMIYNRDSTLNDDKVNYDRVVRHSIELSQRTPKKKC